MLKQRAKRLACVAASASALMLVGAVQGAILFDFGPAGANSNPTNSPAHATSAVPAAETTWNRVVLANLASGSVENADGTTATGVSLVYGRTSTAGSTIDYALLPGSTNGGGGTAGIYSGGSAIKDDVFQSNNKYQLGVRIDGLAAGQYDIYITGRNTASNGAGLSERVYYNVGSTASTFDTSTVSFADISNSQSVTASGSNASYVLGDQYQELSVTLASGNSLYLGVAGTGSEQRPFLNSVEVVAVPEPATIGLCALGWFALAARRRRPA